MASVILCRGFSLCDGNSYQETELSNQLSMEVNSNSEYSHSCDHWGHECVCRPKTRMPTRIPTTFFGIRIQRDFPGQCKC
jgi:hypothetical protein